MMIDLFRLTLASLVLFITNFLTAQSLQHFGNLPFRETPFADFVGIHPIFAEQASNIKHYEITYDEQGRPVKVAQKVGDEVIPFFKDLNIHYLKAPVTLFNYDGNREIRHFTDFKGDTIVVDEGTTYREVFTYNMKGHKESLRFENKEGELVNNSWGIARYEWKVLKNGTVLEKRFNRNGELVQMRPGLDFYVVHFKYRSDGYVDEMVNMGKDGRKPTNNSTKVAKDDIEYTSEGDFKSWATFNAAGEPVNGNSPSIHKGVNYHDELGNVIKVNHYNPEGDLMMSAYGFASIEIMIDRFNFISGYKFYNDKGEMIENRGVAYVINKHNRFGNEVESSVYSKDNKLTLLPGQGFAVVKNVYDAKHRLISSQYFDTTDIPVNRTDNGVNRVEYMYDPSGNRSSKSYNKEGELMID